MAHHMPPRGIRAWLVEQPERFHRFRYKSEGRAKGIHGVNSTQDVQTYPTIRIEGFLGQVTILVSCVTTDQPYRAHPHELVGRDGSGCQQGVCLVKKIITEKDKEHKFQNLGIQSVTRRDTTRALNLRRELNIDPFHTRFDHARDPKSIDLNAVRLAFQVFLHDKNGELTYDVLDTLVSDVIHHKKVTGELRIITSSHSSGSAAGGEPIILLCEKCPQMTRENTTAVFYETNAAGSVVWQEDALVEMVHENCAMVIITPPYTGDTHSRSIPVKFDLRQTLDDQQQQSPSRDFIFLSDYKDNIPNAVVKIEPNRTSPLPAAKVVRLKEQAIKDREEVVRGREGLETREVKPTRERERIMQPEPSFIHPQAGRASVEVRGRPWIYAGHTLRYQDPTHHPYDPQVYEYVRPVDLGSRYAEFGHSSRQPMEYQDLSRQSMEYQDFLRQSMGYQDLSPQLDERESLSPESVERGVPSPRYMGHGEPSPEPVRDGGPSPVGHRDHLRLRNHRHVHQPPPHQLNEPDSSSQMDTGPVPEVLQQEKAKLLDTPVPKGYSDRTNHSATCIESEMDTDPLAEILSDMNKSGPLMDLESVSEELRNLSTDDNNNQLAKDRVVRYFT